MGILSGFKTPIRREPGPICSGTEFWHPTGLATQQADAVAEAIAAEAGAPVTPQPFRPILRGLLLTGGKPAYLRAEIAGGGKTTTVATEALWWPPGKIVGRYLTPFLAENANVTLSPLSKAHEALPIQVEL